MQQREAIHKNERHVMCSIVYKQTQLYNSLQTHTAHRVEYKTKQMLTCMIKRYTVRCKMTSELMIF